MSQIPKLKASISDTDILVNFSSVNRLDILELLFSEIVIPEYILEKELHRRFPAAYAKVIRKINDPSSPFIKKDRRKERPLNFVAKPVIEEYNGLVGPGESECAGYAAALEIPIIISDNKNEFEYMEDEFIMLKHIDLLTLLVFYGVMSHSSAEKVYDDINNTKSRPSSILFSIHYDRAMVRIRDNEWGQYLGVK
jgi:predicted nucleic acid-binding protein